MSALTKVRRSATRLLWTPYSRIVGVWGYSTKCGMPGVFLKNTRPFVKHIENMILSHFKQLRTMQENQVVQNLCSHKVDGTTVASRLFTRLTTNWMPNQTTDRWYHHESLISHTVHSKRVLIENFDCASLSGWSSGSYCVPPLLQTIIIREYSESKVSGRPDIPIYLCESQSRRLRPPDLDNQIFCILAPFSPRGQSCPILFSTIAPFARGYAMSTGPWAYLAITQLVPSLSLVCLPHQYKCPPILYPITIILKDETQSPNCGESCQNVV